ncbi:serine/threonine-protein kinase [Pseudonocardia sp. TRM90224]|uniref:serine/threonine-protein kinase n=1 Tax=Pseudonocardia sp. TRM90224 TaxID=2812678 RepID=UPI001E64C549|nr:serine/threonine-protein kinase [Pseudonocardia sp. TRM90224]
MTEEAPTAEPVRVGGRYRLDERIGAGAMGAVWRGTDELLNRTVAVKELLAAAAPPTVAGGDALEESRQRILREGRIGARLQHPHVISMFDVVVHDDRPWLVMEYLPSKSLSAVIAEKGPLSPSEAAKIGRDVADGLAAAHLAGVVHRDIKPGNVLIGEDGRVKLTDFGVSRAVDDVQLTRTGLIAGTPAFLSPEVAQGRTPTSASDVFALGATLYATVEGTPPFGLDDNAYALLHKVATGYVPPPKHAGQLTGIIMRLLSADPEDRPSAAQARDALAALDGGSPIQLGGGTALLDPDGGPPTMADVPPTPPARPAAAGPVPAGRPPAPAATRRRRRTMLLIAGVAVLALAGGATAAMLSANNNLASQGTGTGAEPSTSAGPSAAAPPTGAPTTTAQTTAPPAADNAIAYVQNYYAQLPGNTEAAWAMLSPRAQAKSNGRAGFDSFWAQFDSVRLDNPRETGPDFVRATVVFVRKDGTTSSEPYSFVINRPNGVMIMEDFSQG